MKKLEKFAAENNLTVVPITYRFKGGKLKRKGFDLIRDKKYIIASFEPCYNVYSNNKWQIENDYNLTYVSRLTKSVLKKLNLNPEHMNILTIN